MNLAGRVARATGASRGIGQAIGLDLARRGADVVLAARSSQDAPTGLSGTLAETAAQVTALGRKVHVVATDLNPIGARP